MTTRIATCLLLAAVMGCGPRADHVQPDDQPAGEANAGGEGAAGATDATGWPSHLLTNEGTGPALYLHPTPDSPAVGYVSAGVRVRVASGPQNERLPVWIDGPLKVRGWLPFDRLAARAQQRGRVDGTPAYLGPNDVVGVRGPAGDGVMRIEVAPRLGGGTLGPFAGTFPAEFLAADEVDPNTVEGPTPGPAHELPAGQEVPLYDRPNGQVVATLPATTPPLVVVVLRDQGEWKGIRAGSGPYVVGFINAPVTPTDRQPVESGGLVGQAAQQSPVPERLMAEADRPLWRVAAGTHVKFDGTTIAQVNEPGWAREMNRYETGEVDVFLAVNDDVAIRGMVSANALQPAEGQPGAQQPAQPQPAQPTQPAQPQGPPGAAQPLVSPGG